MNALRFSAVTALGLGLAVSASNTFAQSSTDPAGIPTDPAPGGLEVHPGIANPAMERQESLAPIPSTDRTTGSIKQSRWSGFHRPVSAPSQK